MTITPKTSTHCSPAEALKKALEFNETDYEGRKIYVSKASDGPGPRLGGWAQLGTNVTR